MANINTLSPKANAILDAAEVHMRRGGFDAVSFRDLAAEVGIKSASVHYHFPQKGDLGEALVNRYTGRVLEFLGDPSALSMSKATDRLTELYTDAITNGGSVCLCCILGAEAQTLPEAVAQAVQAFFESIIGWLKTAYKNSTSDKTMESLAAFVVGSLQGAMTLAIATGDHAYFRAAVDRVKAHASYEEARLQTAVNTA